MKGKLCGQGTICGRIKQICSSPWLITALRVYLGGVFLIACFHKIIDPASFAIDVATYDILPLYLINVTAIVLPWVELAAGLMLVFGFRARAGAVLTAGMMLVFIVALSIALKRGTNMSCGCFASQGVVEDPISAMTVLRDLTWLSMSLWIITFDRVSPGIDLLILKRRAR